jgi:anti-anti-sigma factor
LVTFLDETIVDDSQIKQLQQSFEPVIEKNNGGEMVLNFANVRSMSSAVLGLLVRVHKRVVERGGRLRLCNLDRSLLQVFEITQLTKVFDIS